jgi:hypothetical protein
MERCGAWVSELLPYTARMVDDIAIIRSMHTEAINHEPAIMLMNTGNMNPGKPCLGAWLSYGLGSMNRDLPTFVVLNANHTHPKANVQAISARLWSSGFLSGQYSGVALRQGGDPVLFIANPDGVPVKIRRRMLDALGELNQMQATNWRTRKRGCAFRSMRWRSGCKLPCPSSRISPRNRRAPTSFMARKRAGAEHLPIVV